MLKFVPKYWGVAGFSSWQRSQVFILGGIGDLLGRTQQNECATCFTPFFSLRQEGWEKFRDSGDKLGLDVHGASVLVDDGAGDRQRVEVARFLLALQLHILAHEQGDARLVLGHGYFE